MKLAKIVAAFVTLGVMGLAGSAYSADKRDFGKREYESRCAVCHGMDGKGLGPYAGIIETRIPDITTMAKTNGGVFPFSRVQELIDGRQTVKAHGPSDMPIWGREYRTAAGEAYFDVPYDAEFYVRMRVLALAEYLHRLQVK